MRHPGPVISRATAELREALTHLPIDEAAKLLLGWDMVSGPCRARIVEVEAYGGESDPGSHAWRGMTARTRVMYGPPGTAYVYFTYGVHWMLNVVAGPAGTASAILIRAARPLAGQQEMRALRGGSRPEEDLLRGPGNLAKGLGIDGSHNGCDLLNDEARFRLEPGSSPREIVVGRRVGLSIGRGECTQWRFCDATALAWVSRPHKFEPQG